MKPVCPTCGGPLFKSKCLGYCADRPRLRRVFATGPVLGPGSASTRGVFAPREYALTWEPRYETPKGQPLNVARWYPITMTPAGPIDVWHRMLASVA